MRRYLFFVTCVCILTSTVFSEDIVAPGAKIEMVAGDCKFTEGPASDAEGNVYFTDQPNDRILKYSVNGKLTTFMSPCGRSNGLCVDKKGNIWACADEKNEIWCISPDGKKTVIIKDYKGKLLNGPNDLWVSPRGEIYFSDPFYKRKYWNRGGQELEDRCIYWLLPEKKHIHPVAKGFKQPNGVIGTPDGKKLYVADIGAKKTWVFDIADDASLKNKKLFCDMGSDGMTIDSEGNVYLTGKGVHIFDKTGTKIRHIEVPERWTANVCFGGKDKKFLFITAMKGLYRLKMRVSGVGSQ